MPAAFVRLERMPLSPNGKVAASASGAQLFACRPGQRLYWCSQPGRRPCWPGFGRASFKLESVGVNDNFFELGGDSNPGDTAMARANREGLAITSKDLLERQPIADLAAAARERRTVPAATASTESFIPSTPTAYRSRSGD